MNNWSKDPMLDEEPSTASERALEMREVKREIDLSQPEEGEIVELDEVTRPHADPLAPPPPLERPMAASTPAWRLNQSNGSEYHSVISTPGSRNRIENRIESSTPPPLVVNAQPATRVGADWPPAAVPAATAPALVENPQPPQPAPRVVADWPPAAIPAATAPARVENPQTPPSCHNSEEEMNLL